MYDLFVVLNAVILFFKILFFILATIALIKYLKNK